MNRKNILTILVLILIWLFAVRVYLRDQEYSFTTLENRHDAGSLTISRSGEMLTGDKIVGRFNSQFPNLGIIAVRFYTFYRSNKDVLRFSIKEEGSNNWYYSATYNTDQFQHNKLFPFGFPLISNSQNKNYIFEIESLKGATGSGVFANPVFPAFIDHHVYSRAAILASPWSFVQFVGGKIINLSSDSEFVYNAVNFLLPIIAFLIFLELGEYLIFSIIIILSLILWQVINISEPHYFYVLSMLYYWILLSAKHKISYKVSLILVQFFLILGVIYNFYGNTTSSEDSAVWSFLFLISTSIFLVREALGSSRNVIGFLELKSFLITFILTIRRFDFTKAGKMGVHNPKMILPRLASLKVVIILRQIMSKRIFGFIISLSALLFSVYLSKKLINYIINLKEIYVEYYMADYIIPFLTNVMLRGFIYLSIPALISYSFYKSLKSWPITIMGFLLLANIILPKRIGISPAMIRESKIYYISPSVTQEAWTDVSVVGKNFKDKPFVGKIYIDGVEQGVYVVDWSDERVIFRTSPEITKSGMVQVIPLNGKPSNKVQFIYNFK